VELVQLHLYEVLLAVALNTDKHLQLVIPAPLLLQRGAVVFWIPSAQQVQF
jgi:hypothetical protein